MSAHLSSIDGESPVDRQRLSPKLAQAFEAFTETSSLLQQSYGDLQHRVTVLSEQLAEARDDRSAQLAETERLAARLASLLATLPGTVLVLDEAQRVQDHNESASELFGDALVGEHWDQLLQRVAATSVDGGGELHFVDGRRISVSVGPLRGEGGLIMLLTDVTETRELQALVQRQERLSAMGEMLARLAHQARTPLATAILYASQLRRTPLQGNAAVFTSRIVTRLKHLENMIDDMLCFARGNPGGSTPLVVTELLDGALGALATGAAERVTVQTPPSTYTVRGNRRALCGALSNLIENALSMRPTTKVMLSVALSDDERHIVLRVIDDGPGIDDSLHERIFEPFFTTRNNGTGLGLAVVRSVADGHGGRAYVARSAPNEGATLHLELPRADVTALATTEVPKLPHLERSHAR